MNLEGGYYSWLRSQFENEDYATDVEKSIRKNSARRFGADLLRRLLNTSLLSRTIKLPYAFRGQGFNADGKAFQELKRHNKFPFELVFLVMDPGYSVENRDVIESNARRLNIPITVFETDIFNSVYNVDKYPCYLCARMRRGYLYKRQSSSAVTKSHSVITMTML